MHILFQQFVSLSWCFFSEENTTISSADECVVRPRSSSHHWGPIAGTGSSPLSLPSWMESALSQEVLTTATVRQAFEPTTTFSVLENVLCCDDPTFSLQVSDNDPVWLNVIGSSSIAGSIFILLTGRRVVCGLILANSLLGVSRVGWTTQSALNLLAWGGTYDNKLNHMVSCRMDWLDSPNPHWSSRQSPESSNT